MNLIELLNAAAARFAHKPAVIEGFTIVSYAALMDEISALSAQLGELGLSPGARVGLCYPNSIRYIALTFALWKIGAIVVPVPIECTEEDVEEIATSMELTGMISQPPRNGSIALGSELHFSRCSATAPDNHGLNIAFIRFTSGTTSTRKGVVLCHETIRDRVAAANKALEISDRDTVMWCLPMSHHFLITIVLYLSQGATIALARHVVSRAFLEAANAAKGTVLYAAPFHFALLARDSTNLSLSSVRLAVSTTCSLPEDVARDFQSRFQLPLVQGLGIIELGLVTLNADDPIKRWNSVGRPLPDVRVRILNADAEGCGEVAVQGPGFLDAYAAPWIPREQLLRDGWFVTGDIGWIDEEGYLFLAGRKTAVINLAGRKVFPEEIESVLNRHPSVRESRVFGRLHPHLGEIVEADLVLEPAQADVQAVREFCRKHLASFKVPARFHVVDSLPRTAVTGKIRRPPVIA